ncbi:MAG: START-like domain-containing protein [Prolixibacteraceae bacterium]|nr:START-like domain-containing protein [Prolixibacteraceae bacterium]
MANRVKIQLEYVINCSPKVLFNRLSTASGLAEWFAEDVRVQGKQFTFSWEGAQQTAEMTLKRENRLVRYNWVEEDDSFFEFRVSQDELTGDVSLIVIDYPDEDEREEIKELWDTQIADLKHILGS